MKDLGELTMLSGSALVTLALFVVAVIVVIKAIRVVPQQHAWVVERLGRFFAVLQPGLNFVIPFVDRRRSASRATTRSCRSTASCISR